MKDASVTRSGRGGGETRRSAPVVLVLRAVERLSGAVHAARGRSPRGHDEVGEEAVSTLLLTSRRRRCHAAGLVLCVWSSSASIGLQEIWKRGNEMDGLRKTVVCIVSVQHRHLAAGLPPVRRVRFQHYFLVQLRTLVPRASPAHPCVRRRGVHGHSVQC